MTDYLYDRVTAAVGDQYLIEGEIGRGGMAAVFRARDLRLNRPVAIKALPPELAFNQDVRTRFLREAQMAAQLSHPNIVPIYSVDERGGVVYFVMALVDGESLAARLGRERRLAPVDARRVLIEVADALQYAHEHGVVHRDIKPDNILLDRHTGRAIVTDFGIARAAAVDARLTVTGVAVGTPAYMSPEQAIGEHEVDGRSDQYSLGVVGYQMLAGQTPFVAANTPAMLVKHVSERPRPLSEVRVDLPAPLAAAIERALAKRPEDRWRDAATFRAALEGRIPLAPPDAVPNAARLDLRAVEGWRRDERARNALLPAPQPPAAPPLAPPLAPSFTAPPAGMGRHAWKKWSREQRRLVREQARLARRAPEHRDLSLSASEERRIVRFRRLVVRTAVLIPALFFINLATQGPPWFLFADAALLANLLIRAGGLWADGVSPFAALGARWRETFGIAPAGAARPALPAAYPPAGAPALPALPAASATPADPAATLVAREVIEGAHGAIVRRAATDRDHLRDIVARLTPVEKELLPDVMPTANALAERVAALASTVHRLDADIAGTSLTALDERIAALRAQDRGTEADRRLVLLERQRATVGDLVERRQVLVDQLESASLTLQNLRLDLLKLRSAGVDSSLDNLSSATREARALSRDIGHLLDAANDVRKL